MACSGKVALVTGGAAGIGAACVEELLKNGVKGVVIADTNSSLGEEVVKNLNEKYGNEKTIFVTTDISDKQSFENAFQKTIEKYNNLDIVVNCAGIIDEYNWEKVIQVNLVGTTNGCLLALDYVPKHKTGSKTYIINIASITSLDPFPAAPHYCATKAAILALTRAYGANKYVTEKDIYFMAVCPGATETTMAVYAESKLVYDDLYRECLEGVYRETQPSSVIGEATVKAICQPEHGGVWLASENKISKLKFSSATDMAE